MTLASDFNAYEYSPSENILYITLNQEGLSELLEDLDVFFFGHYERGEVPGYDFAVAGAELTEEVQYPDKAMLVGALYMRPVKENNRGVKIFTPTVTNDPYVKGEQCTLVIFFNEMGLRLYQNELRALSPENNSFLWVLGEESENGLLSKNEGYDLVKNISVKLVS